METTLMLWEKGTRCMFVSQILCNRGDEKDDIREKDSSLHVSMISDWWVWSYRRVDGRWSNNRPNSGRRYRTTNSKPISLLTPYTTFSFAHILYPHFLLSSLNFTDPTHSTVQFKTSKRASKPQTHLSKKWSADAFTWWIWSNSVPWTESGQSILASHMPSARVCRSLD